MSAMVATFRNKYYFCGVKSSGRYEAAAEKQRFLYSANCIYNITARELGISNDPWLSLRGARQFRLRSFLLSNLNSEL
jgi:hypothetical protein